MCPSQESHGHQASGVWRTDLKDAAASNGQIFDASLVHGTAPFSFKLGANQVVPGFDAGTNGMRVGESRIVLIPPSQGYGSTANGAIPANSTLVFIVTLTAIS